MALENISNVPDVCSGMLRITPRAHRIHDYRSFHTQVVSHPFLAVVSHPIFFFIILFYFIYNLAIMKLFKYFDSYRTVFIMLVK